MALGSKAILMGRSSAASSSEPSGSEPRRVVDQHGVYVETSPRTYVFVAKSDGDVDDMSQAGLAFMPALCNM